ncbi:MAG: hypothetical protein M3480_06985 [Verrucomicrobiota bacterium]|nr:hypothetical protein [Verrucomicrobiota bacterium]
MKVWMVFMLVAGGVVAFALFMLLALVRWLGAIIESRDRIARQCGASVLAVKPEAPAENMRSL